ncbi:MAG: glycosyltransferase family 2 protein, partial [Candidatus Rokuibacteriota bacterium]
SRRAGRRGRDRIAPEMPYEHHEQYRRTVADARFRRSLVLRTVLEGVRTIAERVRARRVPLSAVRRVHRLGAADLPLLLVTRNQADLLRAFLRHYRDLGVTRFIVVDDQSSDGTRELLVREDDVDLWGSTVRYGAAKRGLLWMERLTSTYGLGRWYVKVDTDEFLVYDGMERHRLPALCRWLARRRERRLLAPMLDLYASGRLSAAAADPDRPPWAVATHFDTTGYAIGVNERTTTIFGGPRARLFGVRGQLAKFPLMYWDRLTFFPRTPHAPFPYVRNFGPIAGALLHFKLFADFPARVQAAVAEGQYWQAAREYRAYASHLRDTPDPIMTTGTSAAYGGVHDLIERGFVAPIDWEERDGGRAGRRSGRPASVAAPAEMST